MAELDLSKAVEAGARELAPDVFARTDASAGVEALRDDARLEAHTAITAALPHILDALAGEADSERVFAGSLPPVKEDAYIVTRYLRAKAEEVRRG